MINSLVSIARFFLFLQVAVGVILLVGSAILYLLFGSGIIWQLVTPATLGLGLLVGAGFTAVLFQISDRLAELIAQGAGRPHAPPAAPHDARREPTIGRPR